MRRMANDTALLHCLMWVNPRSPLLRVALKARFVTAQERKATRLERLLNICRGTFDRDAFVHLVTISAAHFAFRHRVVVRQLKRRANFQVTLETGFGRLSWIDDRTSASAG